MIDIYQMWRDSRNTDNTTDAKVQEYYNVISRWGDRQQALSDIRDNQASLREGKQSCTLSGMPLASDMGDPTFEKVGTLLILDDYYDRTLAQCWAAYAMHQLMYWLLTDREKELLTLIYYYEYSYIQIAARLRVHRKTVKRLHKNALAKLDAYLDTWYLN